MKKLVAIILLLVSNSLMGITLDQFIDCLQQVESENDPKAIGDNEQAYGILQMHAIMVEDYNRVKKPSDPSYKHNDAFDPIKSRFMSKILLKHYSKAYENLKGVKPGARELSYFWNGSWNRMKNPNNNVKKYWEKVKLEIVKLNK